MSTTATLPSVEQFRDDVGILHHRPDCPGPDLKTYVGQIGDAMVRCRNCGRPRPLRRWMLTNLRDVMETPPEPPEPQEQQNHSPLPSAWSSWRCRTHLDEPVNWKGRGCRQCSAPTIRERG